MNDKAILRSRNGNVQRALFFISSVACAVQRDEHVVELFPLALWMVDTKIVTRFRYDILEFGSSPSISTLSKKERSVTLEKSVGYFRFFAGGI